MSQAGIKPVLENTAAPSAWAILLTQVAVQDKAAFGTLYDHFAPRIKGWVLKMGAPSGKAEDIVQDVMLQIWRRAAQFDPVRADAGTWIFAIARNRYIDLVRQEKRPEINLEDPVLISTEPTPEQALHDRERADRVATAMQQLPAAQRAIIQQSYFAELTQQEIAMQDGVPLGTVKSRLRLAFGRLRELLGDMA
jgi:RNA polymerase sigma factor (sigma-70 family)